MPATHGLVCGHCGKKTTNHLFPQSEEIDRDMPICDACGYRMEIDWSAFGVKEQTQWRESDSIVVFQNKDGVIRYPGQANAKTPAGFERVQIRNLATLDRFCKEHKVASHVREFDSNGRGLDE